MTEGAPPDETGEDPEDGAGATDDDHRAADGSRPDDGGEGDAPGAATEDSTATDDGETTDDVDPDREVVEAVERATGIEVEHGDAGDGATAETGEDGEDATDSDPGDDTDAPVDAGSAPQGEPRQDVPEEVRKYDRFKKIEGGTYDRANEFLRERTYVTAREWAIARLCADFRTETGVEMTKIGENLPELVPFMTDTYTPQAVNQARAAFEEKVRKAGATFLYGAMCDFFTAEELDDVMYESTEVAKFLLEVEGVELSVDDELEAEDRISEVMRDVREHSAALRHDEVCCPECGHEFEADE